MFYLETPEVGVMSFDQHHNIRPFFQQRSNLILHRSS